MTRDEALWQESRFGGTHIGDKLEWRELDVTRFNHLGETHIIYDLVRPRCPFCASPVPRNETHLRDVRRRSCCWRVI